MKGKRYTVEQKIRILRGADRGEHSMVEICREENISEVTFHRWKNQFGQMDVNEARRLKELERENTELKKMLAESLLKNRVLELACEKKLYARRHAGQWPRMPYPQECAHDERPAGFCGWREQPAVIGGARPQRPSSGCVSDCTSCRRSIRAAATGASPRCCVGKAGR